MIKPWAPAMLMSAFFNFSRNGHIYVEDFTMPKHVSMLINTDIY